MIDAWFTNHAVLPITPNVRDVWRKNYVIQAIGGNHTGLVGNPSGVLSGRPIEYALLKWKPT